VRGKNMFCKNCGNKLAEGQAFCTSCGARQEPVENNNNNVVAGNTPEPTITSSTPVIDQAPVNNVGMDNVSTPNNSMPNVNNMNDGNGMNNQNQMANSMNNNNVMNNQNQMGNNMNMNPNVNNMGNNPSVNNNGNPKNNSTTKIIIAAVAIVAVVFMITMVVKVVTDMKNAPGKETETKEETNKESEVGQAGNQKICGGFKFTIPEEYTAQVSGAGELVLTRGDITFTIVVDNTSYEENYQTVITAQPKLKDKLEGTINNRKVSAAYMVDGSVAVFTAASDTQTFFAIITDKSSEVKVGHVQALMDILVQAKKDESTFAAGTESDSSIKDKAFGANDSTPENFKFE